MQKSSAKDKLIKQYWILEAWTNDGRFRYFIVATRDDAEWFRKDLEQMEGEIAVKKPAPMHLILDSQVPWREIEVEDRSTKKVFEKMMDAARKAGPIASE